MTQQQGRANTVADNGSASGSGGLGSLGPGPRPLVRQLSMVTPSIRPTHSVSVPDQRAEEDTASREKLKNSFLAAFNRRCPSANCESGSWSGLGPPHEVGDLSSGAASFVYDGTPKILCPATDCPAPIVKCVYRCVACLGNCGAIGADAVCPATDCPAPINKCVYSSAYNTGGPDMRRHGGGVSDFLGVDVAESCALEPEYDDWDSESEVSTSDFPEYGLVVYIYVRLSFFLMLL